MCFLRTKTFSRMKIWHWYNTLTWSSVHIQILLMVPTISFIAIYSYFLFSHQDPILNLEKFLSLSWPWHFWRGQGYYFVDCLSICVCPVFSHDWTEVMHLACGHSFLLEMLLLSLLSWFFLVFLICRCWSSPGLRVSAITVGRPSGNL